MLQQTVVATVIPYFQRFIARYPEINDLAMAPEDEVLGLWAGLGYYARARNLIACARVVAQWGGFPDTVEGLRKLPGIGAYTAAAIGAIAFNQPVVPVDGNVERVAARIFAIKVSLPEAKPAIAEAASWLITDEDAAKTPGDFAQGLFDLGATICTPRSPSCLICPWTDHCAARRLGLEKELPRRAPKTSRPVRHGVVFVLLDAAGRIGLRRRPPQGMLGGMLELPGTEWDRRDALAPPDAASLARAAPAPAAWRNTGSITHVFTHFILELAVLRADVAVLPEELIAADPATAGLPSVMTKALAKALERV